MRLATLLIGGVVTTLALAVPPAPQAPSVAAGFRQIPLGDSQGLTFVAWAKAEASFDDDEWLQIEVMNSGASGVIKAFAVDAPAESNSSFNSSNILASLTLGVPSRGGPSNSTGNTLPAGRYLTRDPGIVAGAHLRVRPTSPAGARGIDVTIRLNKLSVVFTDGRAFSMGTPVVIPVRWVTPTDAGMTTLRRQTVALLEKALPTALALSASESDKLNALLRVPAAAEQVTLELALEAVRQQQIERSFRFGEVTVLIFRRWQYDPRLIAFYRDALDTRGPEALPDLQGGLWDSSFVEPVIRLVETAGPSEYVVLSRGLTVLDRHYASWSHDASIPPRLTRAVVKFGTASMPNDMYNFTGMLALTHDRGAIAVLRPFLSDKTIDQFTSLSSNMPSGRTPMRHSELAANSICRLLGEPILFDPYKRASAPPGGPFPEWAEWDRKIEELRRRIDR